MGGVPGTEYWAATAGIQGEGQGTVIYQGSHLDETTWRVAWGDGGLKPEAMGGESFHIGGSLGLVITETW